jgi:hypothetical protein
MSSLGHGGTCNGIVEVHVQSLFSMRSPARGGALVLGALGGALGVLLPSPARALQSGASESGLVLAQEFVSCGGVSLTLGGGLAAATLGQPGLGSIATSESFILTGGVAWTVAEVVGTGPIVAGVREATADKDGGTLVDVYGYNFLAPGAGPLAVSFDGVPGGSPVVLSTTHAQVTTPAGLGAFGNPLPIADVEVSNANGSHRAPASPLQPVFAYEPALLQTTLARVGQPLPLHLFTDPGAVIAIVLGQTIPGVGAPVPPIQGSAEVLLNVQFAVPLLPLGSDQHTHLVQIPEQPALAGLTISYQGVAFTNLATLTGAFTNPLTILIHP